MEAVVTLPTVTTTLRTAGAVSTLTVAPMAAAEVPALMAAAVTEARAEDMAVMLRWPMAVDTVDLRADTVATLSMLMRPQPTVLMAVMRQLSTVMVAAEVMAAMAAKVAMDTMPVTVMSTLPTKQEFSK